MEQDNLFKKFNLQFFAGEDDQSDEAGDDDNTDGTDSQKDNSSKAEKTFTQEQVNAMMAREKNQGKRSVYSELGFKNEKDAKTVIANYQKFLASQKSEEEKIADDLKNEQNAKTEAEERAAKAEAKVEALINGVKPECLDDVITLAMARKTDDTEFKDVLTDMKKRYPALFTDSSNNKDDKGDSDNGGKDGKKPGERGTGGSVKNNKDNKDDGKLSLGARLAAQRKGVERKSSFFTN